MISLRLVGAIPVMPAGSMLGLGAVGTVAPAAAPAAVADSRMKNQWAAYRA